VDVIDGLGERLTGMERLLLAGLPILERKLARKNIAGVGKRMIVPG
jgi:hypothetical protein